MKHLGFLEDVNANKQFTILIEEICSVSQIYIFLTFTWIIKHHKHIVSITYNLNKPLGISQALNSLAGFRRALK